MESEKWKLQMTEEWCDEEDLYRVRSVVTLCCRRRCGVDYAERGFESQNLRRRAPKACQCLPI